MCIRSPAMANLKIPKGSSSSSSTVTHVSTLIRKFNDYIVIDVREPDEHKVDGIKDTTNISLGPLLSQAVQGKFDENWKGKKIITYCNVGYRSGIAARELANLGFDATSLDFGIAAWTDPAVANYDFVSVCSNNPFIKENLERATIAITIAVASQANGQNTALVLMGEGVQSAVKSDHKDLKDNSVLKLGDPFKGIVELFNTFIKDGGMIFACRSCLSLRKLTYEQMFDFVRPASAPDVVRWIQNGKGSFGSV